MHNARGLASHLAVGILAFAAGLGDTWLLRAGSAAAAVGGGSPDPQ